MLLIRLSTGSPARILTTALLPAEAIAQTLPELIYRSLPAALVRCGASIVKLHPFFDCIAISSTFFNHFLKILTAFCDFDPYRYVFNP